MPKTTEKPVAAKKPDPAKAGKAQSNGKHTTPKAKAAAEPQAKAGKGKVKAGKPPAVEPKERAPRTKGPLKGTEMRVLAALLANGGAMTRGQLAEETGINKGWSRLLGAHNREVTEDSLEGRGLVEVEEEGRQLKYSITQKGKKLLEQAQKLA